MRLTSANVTLASVNILIIWLGMQATIAEGIDGKGRLISALLLAILMSNIVANRKFYGQFLERKSPAIIFGFWFFYAAANTVIQHSPTEKLSTPLFLLVELLLPFVLVASVSSIRPDKVVSLVRSLQFSFLIFLILLSFDAEMIGGRLVLERFDPNELSLYVFAMACIVALNYFLGLQQYMTTAIYLIFIMIFSILLGSRMGFAGVAFLVTGFFISGRSGGVSVGRAAVLAPIALTALFFILDNTVIGERLMGTLSQADSWKESPVEGSMLKYYGDRGLYYILGWQAFLDSPIFGIGLMNFKDNYYPTVLHSELMIQLAELGLVGFFLYVLFWKRLVSGVSRQSRRTNGSFSAVRYLFYPVVVLLFASTNLFLYSSYSVAIVMGLVLLLSRDDVADHLDARGFSRSERGGVK